MNRESTDTQDDNVRPRQSRFGKNQMVETVRA